MSGIPLTSLALACYVAVAGSCLFAAQIARRRRRHWSESSHWLATAAFFFLIAASRWLDVEEHVRELLRSDFFSAFTYSYRWTYQAPAMGVALVLIAAATAALIFLHPVRRLPPKQRSRLAKIRWIADCAIAAMCGLIVLRVISLHSVDSLLYRGPHLNWLIDLGSSATVFFVAMQYRAILKEHRQHPKRSH